MVGEDITSSALELPPKKARGATEYSEVELKEIATPHHFSYLEGWIATMVVG